MSRRTGNGPVADTTGAEATFRLPAASRTVGLLEYLIVGPILVFVVLSAVGAVGVALVDHAGFPALPVVVIAGVLGLLAIVWLIRFAIRDYRRRAGITVTFGSESLSVILDGPTVTIPLEDVEYVRLAPHAQDAQCVLVLTDGTTYPLPVEAASYSVIRTALEEKLIRPLAAELTAALADGHLIFVAEDRLSATARVIKGVAQIAGGALKMLTVIGIPYGLVSIGFGTLHLRRGWRGRNSNFEISREGLRRAASTGDSAVRPWSDLRGVRTDDAGILLEFATGETLGVSLFSENYLPFAWWVRQLHPKPAPRNA